MANFSASDFMLVGFEDEEERPERSRKSVTRKKVSLEEVN